MAALGELAEELRAAGRDLWSHPDLVGGRLDTWTSGQDLRVELRRHLLELPSAAATAVIRRSRETTTHFAWCLRDEQAEPFTFWLHEYKAQRDWRPGYADSVHNHRYHFRTTIVRGGYLHERYTATISADTGLIASVASLTSATCEAGEAGYLHASDFHRIPKADDGTMTFLVKSREVMPWSLSYDPATHQSHRHVPVESRLSQLATRL